MQATDILSHWPLHLSEKGRIAAYWLAAAVSALVLVAVVVGVVSWLGSTSEVVDFGSPAQFWANAPLLILASLITVTLITPTYALAIIAGAMAFGALAVVVREKMREWSKMVDHVQPGRGSDPHMHIPEMDFEDHTQP